MVYEVCINVLDMTLGHRLCWAHAAWRAADVRGGADRSGTWQGTEINMEAGVEDKS